MQLVWECATLKKDDEGPQCNAYGVICICQASNALVLSGNDFTNTKAAESSHQSKQKSDLEEPIGNVTPDDTESLDNLADFNPHPLKSKRTKPSAIVPLPG
ncbi:unnamed protein product [Cuscuta epithymum]|uniref:Uncharacterized protein n=1 Tax=Cuscuta epithymum TaxID=186058 RepID=A0AAV0GCI8_9ASTE|nr:unnamed protein product [Cuscuta epithymum]